MELQTWLIGSHCTLHCFRSDGMARKQRRPPKCPTFLMKHTRAKIDSITARISDVSPSDHSSETIAKVEEIRGRISKWPRIAADVSKDRRKEIRTEGACIIYDFNLYLSDFDGKGMV